MFFQEKQYSAILPEPTGTSRNLPKPPGMEIICFQKLMKNYVYMKRVQIWFFDSRRGEKQKSSLSRAPKTMKNESQTDSHIDTK